VNLHVLNQYLHDDYMTERQMLQQKVDCRQRINYENHTDMSDFLTVATCTANSRLARNSHANRGLMSFDLAPLCHQNETFSCSQGCAAERL
jgi:hypothetical protein